MRFDDSLDTVLAADMTHPGAIEWTWRQLVDLIGRRRVEARADAIGRLAEIRERVPRSVRISAARGLERADPPADLVALFVDDELSVAAPVVRSARLSGDEWVRLLPAMRPSSRGVLRLRRDLPNQVIGALAAFGPTDFALHGAVVAPEATQLVEPVVFAPPLVRPAEPARTTAIPAKQVPVATKPIPDDFDIPALVARIEAHRRSSKNATSQRSLDRPADSFLFETDAAGTIRWVHGVDRSPLIGVSLSAGRDGRPVQVDGVAAGALARRGRFRDARLEVGGHANVAGSWRISGSPVFEPVSGRFTGYTGTARRPRADEAPRGSSIAGDSLRQLVHELRTPTNAISGFAEMIERELLGPVSDVYREQATVIRGQTLGLLEAIDDLDTAARIEADRLDLHADRVELGPTLARVVDGLAPLLALRGATLSIAAGEAVVCGDARAIERLLSRFLTALVASARPGEAITGRVAQEGNVVALSISRPSGFTAPNGGLFEADAEAEAATEGGPLLGAGFGFRLARRLAAELGGSLAVAAEMLTLRLPTAVEGSVEQATN